MMTKNIKVLRIILLNRELTLLLSFHKRSLLSYNDSDQLLY
jgi:hypothetical protein